MGGRARQRATRSPGQGGCDRPTARRARDPLPTLQLRVAHELDNDRLDVADALADEALHWAQAAGDEWEIAEASSEKAISASNIADLRERVDTAARLLDDVGNPHQLARLLNDAAYGALCLGGAQDAADLAARATPIARRLGSRFDQMINNGNVGLAALLTGQIEAASLAFREELRLCREMVVRPIVFEGLRGLAAIAAAQGAHEPRRHTRRRRRRAPLRRPQDPVEARLDETFFEPARTQLGTDKRNGAARDGGAFSFEDAIAYALDEPLAAIKPRGDPLPAQRR